MTTRLLWLPVIFVATFAVSGCSGPDEPAQSPESRPKGEKTKAELLLGKWLLVKVEKETIGPQANIRAVFTQDGRFIFEATDPTVQHQRSTGTYIVDGNSIRLTTETDTDGPAGKSWDVLIEALTESELVTVAGPANGRQRSVFKRVEPK